MLPKFSRSAAARVIAVADVGSASAGLAIVALHGSRPAVILAHDRAELPLESRTAEAAKRAVVAALQEVSEKMLAEHAKKGGAPVSECVAVIRAPWTRSKTIRAVSHSEEEVAFSKKLLSTLARDGLAQQKFFDAAAVMEASVIRVELNGYQTAAPQGKRAHTVAVSMLVSDCDADVVQGVREGLARVFSAKPSLRSGVRASLALLRESDTLPSDCVVVEMSGHATSIVAVRDGISYDHALLPEGVLSMLKRFSDTASAAETRSLVRRMMSDESDDTAGAHLRERIANAEPELVRMFGETFAKLSALRRLPNALLLIAPADLAQYLTAFFSRIDFTQFTMTMRPFEPRALAASDLAAFVEAEGGEDPELAVAAALVNIENRE